MPKGKTRHKAKHGPAHRHPQYWLRRSVLLLAILLAGILMYLTLRSGAEPKQQGPNRESSGSQVQAPKPPASPLAYPGFYPASYTIDATYSVNPRQISGTQNLRYVNAEGQPMQSLYFRLWTNEKVFTDLDGGTQITGVRVNGTPARFSVKGTELEVFFPVPLADGEMAEVALEFTTKIPSIAAPFGYASGVTALGVWHPVLAVYDKGKWDLSPTTDFGEPYFAEVADYEVRLTLPGTLTPVATGVETNSKDTGNQRTVTYKAGAVRDFAMAIGENLSRKSQKVGDTTVNIYYRPESASRADRALDLASKSLQYFSKLFGTYPYPELDIVDAPLVAGTEYSTLTFASMSSTPGYLFDAVIPHEVAHQWWYVQVGSDQFRHPWLDESLATYSEWLSAGEAESRFPGTITPPVPLGSPVDAFPSTSVYQEVTYLYGAQLYRDLAAKIGEETLIQGLRDYVKEYRFKIATPADLIRVLSTAAGTDLTPYFKARGVDPDPS